MAARDKIAERMQPYLEPGEQIRHAFAAQTGPSPYWAFVTWLVMIFGAKYRLVAVTDRSVVVCRASMFKPFSPKDLLGRLPREPFSPVRGLWGKTTIGPETMWVHKRFHRDVDAANHDLGSMPA